MRENSAEFAAIGILKLGQNVGIAKEKVLDIASELCYEGC